MEKIKALVFEPHDDDLAIGIGGTVIQLLEAGWEVKSILMTDGRHGSEDLSPEELVQIREEEKAAETEYLGIECERLEIEDGTLADRYQGPERPNIVSRIEDLVDEFGPDVVFTPSPAEGHPDHRATTAFARDAIEGALEVNYLVWEIPFQEGDPGSIEKVVKVNVDKQYRRKKDAIKLHESQESRGRYSEMANHFNAYCSLLYSTYDERDADRVEVVGFPRQDADPETLVKDLDSEDVTSMSHGRKSENIGI